MDVRKRLRETVYEIKKFSCTFEVVTGIVLGALVLYGINTSLKQEPRNKFADRRTKETTLESTSRIGSDRAFMKDLSYMLQAKASIVQPYKLEFYFK